MSFGYLGLEGPVDLKNPQVEFVVFEDCKLSMKGGTNDRRSYWYGHQIRSVK